MKFLLRAFILLLFLLNDFFSYSQYCVPLVTGSVASVGITNVSLNTINNNTPFQEGYQDYTAFNTNLSRNAAYNLSITVGFTSQSTIVWIDWNQNGVLTDPGEDYDLGNLAAGVPFTFLIYVPPSATLGNTRVRIASDEKGNTVTACNLNQASGDIEDYAITIVDNNMVHDSTRVFQVLSTCVMPPQINQRIIGIEISTSNTLNALQATQFTITTAGTTSLADITNAQLWYTGNSNIFVPTNLFGSNTPGANFQINGAQTLQTNTSGKNYFWLTFDIVAGATAGNTIDAQCTDIVVGGANFVPVVTNPAGSIDISNPNTYLPPPSTYVWYFGKNAGIDFKCSPPKPLVDGKLSTDEGCSAVCDANGNILFYTDGITVWDGNHTAMTNGTNLNGGKSTCQSALIVPLPMSNSLYYIFTQDQQIGPNGFRYSIVNITQNAVTVKNQLLLQPATEQQAAVIHCNKRDYWIITHEFNTNKFYAYLLTPSGLMPPVVSAIGPVVTGVNANGQGIIKFSPNGKKLACSNYSGLNNKDIGIYDFCSATGIVSNYLNIPLVNPAGHIYYGLSFSSDGSKLYTSESMTGSGKIYQYDLNAAGFLASRTLIGTSNYSVGTLQLAPDLKIYGARLTVNVTNLLTINFPNQPGLACNFVDNSFSLAGKETSAGLPNYPENYFNTDVSTAQNPVIGFSYTNACSGDSVAFTDTSIIPVTSCSLAASWRWFFGDASSGTADSSHVQNPKHVYSSTGTYTVTLLYQTECLQDSIKQAITILPRPTASASDDTTICSGNTITLSASGGTSYVWNTGASTSVINVSPSANTTFSVIVFSNGCKDTADVQVIVLNLPTITINGTNAICIGDSVTLTASGGTAYLWNNGSTASIITVHPTSGTSYSIIVSDGQCSDIASFTLSVSTIIPIADAGPDDTICEGQTTTLNGNGGNTYLWNTGATTSSINVSPLVNTSYTITTYNGACFDIDSAKVIVYPIPTISAGNNVNIVLGSSTVLSANGSGSYLWYPSGGLSCLTCSNPTASPQVTTKYYVLVTDGNGCTNKDSIIVTVDILCGSLFIPNVFSPNGDGQNDVFKIKNNCIITFHLKIYDRWGEKVFESADINNGWDGTHGSNGKKMNGGIFVYYLNAILQNQQVVNKKGNITLVK